MSSEDYATPQMPEAQRSVSPTSCSAIWGIPATSPPKLATPAALPKSSLSSGPPATQSSLSSPHADGPQHPPKGTWWRTRQASLRLRLRFQQGQLSPRTQAALLLCRGSRKDPGTPQGDGARLAPGPVEPSHASSASASQGPAETQSSPQENSARFAQEQAEPEPAAADTQASDDAPQGPPLLSTHCLP